MSDVPLVNVIVQGGSFALLALVVVYVGRVLIPRIFAEHVRIIDKFDLALERRDATMRDTAREIASEMKSMAGEIRELNGRVKSLEDRTGEHVPLPESKGKRTTS